MQNTVLDSYGVLALLFDEPGAEQVQDVLVEAADAGASVLMSAVNWAEVLYRIRRSQGANGVTIAQQFERAMPLDIVDADQAIAETAAQFKANHKLSLADAFAAALAKMNGARLVTGDPEFRQLSKTLDIIWLAQKPKKKK